MESLTEKVYEIEIKSPTYGIFFAYPIINVGDKIKKGQKIYSIGDNPGFAREIESEYSGVVKKIFAEDGAKVGYGDRIILIEVDAETFENYQKSKKENSITASKTNNLQHFEDFFTMKNYILKEGRKFVDFIAGVDIGVSIIAFIAGIFIGLSESSWTTFWTYAGVAFVYYQITLIKNYAIYLFIDMRDSLKKLTKTKAEKDI